MRINFLLARMAPPTPAASPATAVAEAPAGRPADLPSYLSRVQGALAEVRAGLPSSRTPPSALQRAVDSRTARLVGLGGLMAGCALGAAALGTQGFLLTAAAQALAFLGGLIFSGSGQKELLEDVERLRLRATRDALTGLHNRGSVEDELHRVVEAGRQDGRVAVILADIDHFKRLNDTWGHQVGDRVLQEVAARMEASVRGEDVVGRYGGEEMIVVMPDAGLLEGTRVAERIRQAVGGEPVEGGIQVTVSLGVAAAVAPDDMEPSRLVRRADEALYRAKAAGRNRVEVG